MTPFLSKIASAAIAIMVVSSQAIAQDQTTAGETSEPKGTFLLTIFLKHDQWKPLEQINAETRQQSFYKAFPRPGTEVVSWYVMMGIGQVVTLRVPAERLREVNRAIEQTAWAPFAPSSIRLTTSKPSLKNFTPKGSELIYRACACLWAQAPGRYRGLTQCGRKHAIHVTD